jgi:MerR family transcriptional regulator/heat shock protein HspR
MKKNYSDKSKALYVISVAAALTGMHPQTLRIYEKKGLLFPERTGGGSRRYSQEDIETLQRIAQLTMEGLNLEGIKRVLELEKEIALLKEEIQRLKETQKQEISEVHKLYRRDLVPKRSAIEVFYRKFQTH